MIAVARTPGSAPLALAVCAGLLAACTGGDQMADLRTYVQQVEARPARPIEPLPEIKPYETYAYSAGELRDPFEVPQATEAVGIASAPKNGIRPDANRPREPLEGFPLDALRMVGTLDREGHRWGIVKARDGAVYRVQEGNFVGQNYGKITRISEQQMDLTEVVPDGQGGWLERPASLALNDQSRGG